MIDECSPKLLGLLLKFTAPWRVSLVRVSEIDSWFSVTKIGRAGGYARTQKAMYPCTYVLEIQKTSPNCKKIALRAAFGQVHRYIEISKIARAGTHGYTEGFKN